jgi:hypothetical protein
MTADSGKEWSRWTPRLSLVSLVILAGIVAMISTLTPPSVQTRSVENARALLAVAASTARSGFVAYATDNSGGDGQLTIVNGLDAAWYRLPTGVKLSLSPSRLEFRHRIAPEQVLVGCSFFQQLPDGSYEMIKHLYPIGGAGTVLYAARIDESRFTLPLTTTATPAGDAFAYQGHYGVNGRRSIFVQITVSQGRIRTIENREAGGGGPVVQGLVTLGDYGHPPPVKAPAAVQVSVVIHAPGNAGSTCRKH